MGTAKLLQSGLETKLVYDGKTERLLLKEYPLGFDDIAAQFCAFHLLAPHLPKDVRADFPISTPVKKLINDMYRHHGKRKPEIFAPNSRNGHHSMKTSKQRAVISYSAGKDSMWNLWWAQKKYGKENVIAVHISGLNTSNSPDEKRYSIRQSRNIGFNLDMLDLTNSSGGKGFDVMRSRDMFMAGLLIPYAAKYGAGNIIIEGFGEVDDGEPFTAHEHNMKRFNSTLNDMGIPVQVKWKNRKEMDVVKELYENVPEWMPDVCNCFSAGPFKTFHHKSWNGGTDVHGRTKKGRTPTFKLYDSQCGSCVKCRIVNIGRILYDKGLDADVDEIRYYIESTGKWFAKKEETHHDMISFSFLRDLKKAARKYDVELKI